jgi:hypothetical protein
MRFKREAKGSMWIKYDSRQDILYYFIFHVFVF